MDIYDTPRPPLVPAERNSNASSSSAAAVTTFRPRTREVSSRYKSPIPSTPSVSRRCPSPTLSRTSTTNLQSGPKRAQSAERRRPSTPRSPPSPSTPVRDSSVDTQLPSRRLSTGGRLQESLWPSTMRSLSVSFQSDSVSIPVSKKEKPVSNVPLDRTLRPSSNVGRQVETPGVSRKPTPERKRSPLKGKNMQDQSENARPLDSSHSRLIDQHRWPSRIGGKLSSSSLNKSVDLADKTVRGMTTPIGIGLSSLRRMPTPDGSVKPLQKAFSDTARLSSQEENRGDGSEVNSVDDSLLQAASHKIMSTSLSERLSLTNPANRSHSLPSTFSRPASPSRMPVSRGVSPSRTRPSTPPRGVSPTRIRPSSMTTQSNNPTSVLTFIADFKKVKKGASYIEDAHHLRLLYNRYLQWRFANAKAESVLYVQKVAGEKTLYNVWDTTVMLWDSVIRKRINLQVMKLEQKLNAVLNNHMACLDDWALLERDHLNSLSGAVEDLKASTLRLPLTGGAKADIESVKLSICSAVDMMQAMGSSICSLLSRVEQMNNLAFGLASIASQEKAMLGRCEALMASAAAMQVEEQSVQTHLLQMKQSLEM